MKLTEFLYDAGRPVAYYPKLRRITGSTNATIFLCQFIYWTGKEASGDGWIYKTADEIEEETGLSYDEQKTAREKLVKSGVIQEKYKRLDHQMTFKVNKDTINELWSSGNTEPGIPETGIAALGKQALPCSLSSTTESTTENTTEEKPAKKGNILDGMIHYAKSDKAMKIIDIRARFEHALRLSPSWDGVVWRGLDEWLIVQEAAGTSFDTWAQWWKSDDFRSTKLTPTLKPSKIKETWNMAFLDGVTITKEMDGFYG